MPITWALFQAEFPDDAPSGAAPAGSLARYQVGQVIQIRGAAAGPGDERFPTPGSRLRRIESPSPPWTDDPPERAARFSVRASIQHLVYTGREERDRLLALSSKGSGPTTVLIPLRKSDAWWAMAQDERQSYFVPGKRGRGHTAIGMTYTDRIFRRLYHARYTAQAAPNDDRWDFVTYFEFVPTDEGLFRDLLGELRDPLVNPEWSFVEREMEIWTTRLPG